MARDKLPVIRTNRFRHSERSEESVLGESELNIIAIPHALDTRVESIYRCLVTTKT